MSEISFGGASFLRQIVSFSPIQFEKKLSNK
ncbi:hypothetical protein CI610_03781 [invertebrate metagenome]|uniref:Uncharacterized protein n=1 Tax=invertebrate metagenome TaxID=1711999 RepID=A0A2H9T250_9ZZZZ